MKAKEKIKVTTMNEMIPQIGKSSCKRKEIGIFSQIMVIYMPLEIYVHIKKDRCLKGL